MKRWFLIFPLILTLLLSGCGGGGEVNGFAPPEEMRLKVSAGENGAVYEPLIREFEARTGIWVELDDGEPDVLLGSAGDGGEIFCCVPVVLVYNTRLVRRNPPEKWADLTSPAWSGKAAFPDPSSEEGLLALCMLTQATGIRSLKALAENLEGSLQAGSRQVVSSVAEGSFYIGAALEATALAAIDGGQDIAIVYPAEGTAALTEWVTVLSGCVHQENARAFADFLLGGDVQQMLTEELHRRPAGETFEKPEVSPAQVLSAWKSVWKEAGT